MRIITRARKMYRTSQLIKISSETGQIIVTPTRGGVVSTTHLATMLHLQIPDPMTWGEFTSGSFVGRRIPGFLIDDLEHCLAISAGGHPVNVVVLPAVEELANDG